MHFKQQQKLLEQGEEEFENQSKDNQNVVKRRIKKSIRDIIEQHRINTHLRSLIGKYKENPDLPWVCDCGMVFLRTQISL